jgi:hypothetical protein
MWFKPIIRSFVKTAPIINNPLKDIAIRNFISLTSVNGLMMSNYQLHNLVQMLVGRETENCGLS